MKLIINDTCEIHTDKYNYILMQKVKSKKRGSDEIVDKWTEVGYFPVLQHALNRILQEEIKAQDEVKIEMLIDTIKRAEKNILNSQIVKAVKDIKRNGDEKDEE